MYQNNSIFRYNLSRDSKASRASQRSQDERRINAPPLTVPPVFADGQSIPRVQRVVLIIKVYLSVRYGFQVAVLLGICNRFFDKLSEKNVFQNIRNAEEEEWYFSVVDVVGVLTDSITSLRAIIGKY